MSRFVATLFLLGAVAGIAACAAGAVPGDEESDIDCNVDSDCPGAEFVCDLLTNTCTKRIGGARDTGGGGGPGDVSDAPVDTGVDGDPAAAEDSGSDANEPDGSDVDSGVNPFSGCTGDGDCSEYLVCNTNLGRCEDPRTDCDGNDDCSSGERCIAGECVRECGTTSCGTGRTCQTLTRGSSVDLCFDTCQPFGAGGSGCGEDRECIPFFGAGEGLCRGIGRNGAGESCSLDFSADACRAGHLCVNNRGDNTCRPMCAESGSPGCSSGSYCAARFRFDRSDNEVSNPAGWCHENCGGLGRADSGLCPSGKACQPDSANEGYCTNPGSAGRGDACGSAGSPYCQVGNLCTPSTTQDRGLCRSMCDPGRTASNNACRTDQACLQIEVGYGVCLDTCPFSGTRSSDCPAVRPYCASPTGVTTTPSNVSGLCTTPP